MTSYVLERGTGGMSSTTYKLIRLSDGRIPTFASYQDAKEWAKASGIKCSFGPYVRQITKLTKQHVLNPEALNKT